MVHYNNKAQTLPERVSELEKKVEAIQLTGCIALGDFNRVVNELYPQKVHGFYLQGLLNGFESPLFLN